MKNRFVNRLREQSVFESAVLGEGLDELKCLVFYGPGGHGKTALRKHLQDRCATDKSFSSVVISSIDLHGQDTQDTDRLLVAIRNGFAKHKIGFPRFDLAFAVYWETYRIHETYPVVVNPWLGRTSDTLKNLSPDVVTEIREIVEDTVESIPGLGILVTRGSGWAIKKSKMIYLKHRYDELSDIFTRGNVIDQSEFRKLLSKLLASDLNDWTARNSESRLVLMVDEFERVLEQGGSGSRWQSNAFEDSLKTFLKSCERLLMCFFSREKVDWIDQLNSNNNDSSSTFLLSELSVSDCEEWLDIAGYKSKEIKSELIALAQVSDHVSTGIYPLLLSLLLEVIKPSDPLKVQREKLKLIRDGKVSSLYRDILKRVLRDFSLGTENVIEYLSVSSFFDRETYLFVIKSAEMGVPASLFDRIINLSIISEYEGKFYRLHRAVTDILRKEIPAEDYQNIANGYFDHFCERLSREDEITQYNLPLLLSEALRLGMKCQHESISYWLENIISCNNLSVPSYIQSDLWSNCLTYLMGTQFNNKVEQIAVAATNLIKHYLLMGQGDQAVMVGAEYEAQISLESSVPESVLRNFKLILAKTYIYESKFSDAIDLLTKEANLIAAMQNKELIAEADSYLADAYWGLQDFENTSKAIERSLRHLSTLPERSLVKETRLRVLKCSVAVVLGGFDEAERELRECKTLLENKIGKFDLTTAMATNALASCHLYKEEYSQAQPIFEEALQIYERLTGEFSADTGRVLNNIGVNIDLGGDSVSAVPILRRALKVWTTAFGDKHYEVALAQCNLARALSLSGQEAEALTLANLALSSYRAIFDDDHIDTSRAHYAKSLALMKLNRFSEAKVYAEKSYEIRSNELGENHPYSQRLANLIAEIDQSLS